MRSCSNYLFLKILTFIAISSYLSNEMWFRDFALSSYFRNLQPIFVDYVNVWNGSLKKSILKMVDAPEKRSLEVLIAKSVIPTEFEVIIKKWFVVTISQEYLCKLSFTYEYSRLNFTKVSLYFRNQDAIVIIIICVFICIFQVVFIYQQNTKKILLSFFRTRSSAEYAVLNETVPLIVRCWHTKCSG